MMKKLIPFLLLVFLCVGINSAHAQSAKKSKGKKGMGTQEDLDADMKDAQEKQMSKEDKKNLKKKKKEVAAKRKKDEVTRKRADKKARERLNKTKKGAARKKKNYVKTHGGK